jgi:adenosylcobinamide-GDP ribazoletransferase
VGLGPTGALGVVGGLAAGELVLARCRKRLGGVTGDVLGAVCEVAVATSLLIFAAG